jgi:acetyl esterase/lipase
MAAPQSVRFVPDVRSGDGVLVLAGSSGRIDAGRAACFAEIGFVAESLRWFGGPGQHSGPWEVPLETFTDRIDRLRAENDRVWVVGTSIGAEAALLLGGRPDVDGVIAFAPSDVVWSWSDDDGAERSHWTSDGVPLPFVPMDRDGYVPESPPRFRPLYEQSYERNPSRAARATIPVGDIRQLLLVAGGDDQVWPSCASVERIVARRRAVGLDTVLVTAPDAGHRTVLPGEPVVVGGRAMHRGGSEQADRALGARARDAIIAFTAR